MHALLTLPIVKWLGYLLSIFFTFYRIYSSTTLPRHSGLKLCILAVSTGVAQEWILLIIINSPTQYVQARFHINIYTLLLIPALMALVDIFTTSTTHSRVCRNWCTATWTLQHLRWSLQHKQKSKFYKILCLVYAVLKIKCQYIKLIFTMVTNFLKINIK